MLFQDKLKELRESHKLLQRQVAAGIDIDTAVYCKIENGDRQAREEQVRQLASFYGVPYEELRRYWLAGKVYSLVEEEKDANGILYMVAEEMEEYGNHSIKMNMTRIENFRVFIVSLRCMLKQYFGKFLPKN